MFKELPHKIKKSYVGVRDFLDEKGIGTANRGQPSRLQRFAHFWLVVWKNFSRNRCPVHASALAYTTLLALIPILAVALSITTSLLNTEDQRNIDRFVDRVVANMAPPSPPKETPPPAGNTNEVQTLPPDTAAGQTNNPADDGNLSESSATAGRQELVRWIHRFIENVRGGIRRGTLGLAGGVLLVFIAISLLSRIEGTFNDIWGVARGRSFLDRIVKYSAVIFLGALLLGVGVGVASAPRLQSAKHLIESLPFVFKVLPVVLLCLGFAVFYMLMPNTRVRWQAALIGGLIAGILWHLNNYFSVFYVSRWVSNSRIYGSLAVIPVFMVGLYFSWLILLFGAQVAYAFQNRAAYLQQKQAENVNQRGREFVALRLMQYVGARFLRGDLPATVAEMANDLVVPSRLAQQIMHTLIAARLVVEVAGGETAYAPARPLERISCHDILLALRAGHGQELETRDEPARAEVYGEFQKILEAERTAASCITVLAMVNRAEKLEALPSQQVKAVTDGKHGRN